MSKTYMGVRCPCNVLRARAVLDGKDTLPDHLTRVGANDVHTQNAVGLGLSDELHDTLSVEVRLRARVSRERELADLVLDARGLEGVAYLHTQEPQVIHGDLRAVC